MPTPKKYRINEVFLTQQGEGYNAGMDAVFVRFTGCNLRCRIEPGPLSPGGFDCDTEFESGRSINAMELIEWIKTEAKGQTYCVVLTGGEPGLQIDQDLITELKAAGIWIAIETNGSIELPPGLDWITVSPKVAEHAIRQLTANEVKYVRGYGQAAPKTRIVASHYFLSPAFEGISVPQRTLNLVEQLCQENPPWKISLQQHKLAGLK